VDFINQGKPDRQLVLLPALAAGFISGSIKNYLTPKHSHVMGQFPLPTAHSTLILNEFCLHEFVLEASDF